MSGENEIVGQVAEVEATEPNTAEIETESEGQAPEKAETADENRNLSADEIINGELSPEQKIELLAKANAKRTRHADNKRKEAAMWRSRAMAAQKQLESLQKAMSQNTKEAPQMEKFESVIDYMKADQTYTVEQALAKQQNEHKMSVLKQQQEIARQQQAENVAAQMNEMISTNQDVQKVISSNASVIQQMPAHIEQLMAEIDNAPAATYALAKEGRLQDLYHMPPHIAAAHLVQAEIRGEQYLQQAAKPKVQAPAPIGKPAGSGKSSTKPLHLMTPAELDKWRKS